MHGVGCMVKAIQKDTYMFDNNIDTHSIYNETKNVVYFESLCNSCCNCIDRRRKACKLNLNCFARETIEPIIQNLDSISNCNKYLFGDES